MTLSSKTGDSHVRPGLLLWVKTDDFSVPVSAPEEVATTCPCPDNHSRPDSCHHPESTDTQGPAMHMHEDSNSRDGCFDQESHPAATRKTTYMERGHLSYRIQVPVDWGWQDETMKAALRLSHLRVITTFLLAMTPPKDGIIYCTEGAATISEGLMNTARIKEKAFFDHGGYEPFLEEFDRSEDVTLQTFMQGWSKGAGHLWTDIIGQIRGRRGRRQALRLQSALRKAAHSPAPLPANSQLCFTYPDMVLITEITDEKLECHAGVMTSPFHQAAELPEESPLFNQKTLADKYEVARKAVEAINGGDHPPM